MSYAKSSNRQRSAFTLCCCFLNAMEDVTRPRGSKDEKGGGQGGREDGGGGEGTEGVQCRAR